MSVSSEWISLKATWGILLIALIARIILSGQFLLTPEEALYWQTGYFSQPFNFHDSPLLSWLIKLSTAIFGNNETAVRLPSLLSVTLGSFYIALIAAVMFSWHTGLHVTVLSQGILQFNLLALLISPYSLVFTCWSAVCYHASQAMHSHRTGEWLFAGFWFGIGLLCNFSMVLLLPCIVLCFILIRPFRVCLFYPGPWLAFMFTLFIVGGVLYWMTDDALLTIFKTIDVEQVKLFMIPDFSYSLQFLLDQTVLLTPFVFLLVIIAWAPGIPRRDFVAADARFLVLTSLPLFVLFFVFPGFADYGTVWTAPLYITVIILLAGLHSSTRSNFKGRPKLIWILACISAYLVTIPLLLQLAYPTILFPFTVSQTTFMNSGWDGLGQEIHRSIQELPEHEDTFIFCMEPRLTGVLSFYTAEHPQAISLDHQTMSQKKEARDRDFKNLRAKDALGLVPTKAALAKIRFYFEKVVVKKEVQLQTFAQDLDSETRSYFIVHAFNFKPSDYHDSK